jgi:hypothetical protein
MKLLNQKKKIFFKKCQGQESKTKVLFAGCCQWEGEGYKKRVEESEYDGNIL